MDSGLASVVEGQASENHEAFKETCERLGLPLNHGKRVVAASRGALQGVSWMERLESSSWLVTSRRNWWASPRRSWRRRR